jgi:hypothetical protein
LFTSVSLLDGDASISVKLKIKQETNIEFNRSMEGEIHNRLQIQASRLKIIIKSKIGR